MAATSCGAPPATTGCSATRAQTNCAEKRATTGCTADPETTTCTAAWTANGTTSTAETVETTCWPAPTTWSRRTARWWTVVDTRGRRTVQRLLMAVAVAAF